MQSYAEAKQNTRSVIAQPSTLIPFVRKTTRCDDTFQALNGFADQKMHSQLVGTTVSLIGTTEHLAFAARYPSENVLFATIQESGPRSWNTSFPLQVHLPGLPRKTSTRWVLVAANP
ncbi:hypothetical protein COCC4DRAFT_149971 [Bipolaris maydis ATCC 48331]|uniref:Uncharacterized protein n=2 Tax=Cochliobolus heterostrophus TaxID=5016 RepID=M2U3R3_COCH5|nr:uncharacterized protein COCC4DRAFT_149971 [Bipolaris maydis ATCC 48331]EMD88356.1 hypothetical protein COCHEDRAFT_1216280 [Bipolaris maydis C5]KAH7556293.1 hypothetical protein BM1_05727 [Bipolaris maydis]ENI00802.1 hypothetical protein COCC4DRAFT_149971 [Bipolaris maydis ATCC 48331]KAJ5028352.1 hypothetical protein J3E73DRAFT_367269 [Bipolaris maydis]KAJ6272525.1 hypothetical protein PSV08DRAFT_349210 [Bipolaris maydis]